MDFRLSWSPGKPRCPQRRNRRITSAYGNLRFDVTVWEHANPSIPEPAAQRRQRLAGKGRELGLCVANGRVNVRSAMITQASLLDGAADRNLV